MAIPARAARRYSPLLQHLCRVLPPRLLPPTRSSGSSGSSSSSSGGKKRGLASAVDPPSRRRQHQHQHQEQQQQREERAHRRCVGQSQAFVPPSPSALARCLEDLAHRFGKESRSSPDGRSQISTNPNVLEAHGRDESFHPPHPPNAVVYPESTEDVAEAVAICSRYGVPIIPFGAGTSLEGHIHALCGGVSLDMARMDSLLELNAADMDCRVQAGITRSSLAQALRQTGLFFPVDPGADATIGGMTSTRASGTTTVRYGSMHDNVIGLTAVTPGGQVVRTGTRVRKSSTGYDLTKLLVGSEGTLAVITEVHLRLHAKPSAIAGARVTFPNVSAAVTAAMSTLQMGVPLARCELLDAVSMAAMNSFSGLAYPVLPTLFLEFHGFSDAAVREQAEVAREVATDCGADEYAWSNDPKEREKLWHARHQAYYAAKALRPGCSGQPTDVCVPRSRLAECIEETQRDIVDFGLVAPVFGHVGDGNFHVILTHHEQDSPELVAATAEVNRRLIVRALGMGGTCSGEHGIGCGKLQYMDTEHGSSGVAMMRTVKDALDPTGILNPGKLFLD